MEDWADLIVTHFIAPTIVIFVAVGFIICWGLIFWAIYCWATSAWESCRHDKK